MDTNLLIGAAVGLVIVFLLRDWIYGKIILPIQGRAGMARMRADINGSKRRARRWAKEDAKKEEKRKREEARRAKGPFLTNAPGQDKRSKWD